MKFSFLSLLFYSFIFVYFFSFIAKAEENYIQINYGITSHDSSVTDVHGAVFDNADEGFIFSAGSMIGDIWGVDLMYFDLGSQSITLDASDKIKSNKVTYIAQSAGTISSDISGYGTGIVLASTNDRVSSYLKVGIHSWDKSGSTTILDNDAGFAGEFYNNGIGAYGGLGLAVKAYQSVSIVIAYDIIGLSNKVGFNNSSTLFSVGLRVGF